MAKMSQLKNDHNDSAKKTVDFDQCVEVALETVVGVRI